MLQLTERRTSPSRIGALVTALCGSNEPIRCDPLIDRLWGRERQYDAQSFIHDDDTRPARPLMITQGWAARLRWLPDGRRQFITILLPGDVLAQQADSRALSHLAVMALTNVSTVDMTSWLTHGESADVLNDGLRREKREEDDRVIDQVVRLGRQRALERVAHWIMEISDRLTRVGLCEEGAFAMPLTQEVMGDTLGLSIVHINRMVQELRRRGLITFSAGRMVVLDHVRLGALANRPVCV